MAVAAAISCESLYRFFHAGDEETLALRGVSLAVQPGETVAVTGPSGSGKSTLLACLAGLDEPDGGTVHVGDQRLTRRSEEGRAALRARSIGVLYQHVNLVGHLDLARNVWLARRLRRGAVADGSADVLERVGLADRRDAVASQLSGGELARAGLAVALANDPDVLLCDEPTGELDAQSAARVLELLAERALDGGAIVVVTHNPVVSAAADRVIELRDGAVVTP